MSWRSVIDRPHRGILIKERLDLFLIPLKDSVSRKHIPLFQLLELYHLSILLEILRLDRIELIDQLLWFKDLIVPQ